EDSQHEVILLRFRARGGQAGFQGQEVAGFMTEPLDGVARSRSGRVHHQCAVFITGGCSIRMSDHLQ
ncbi:hypothetical protein ABTK60_19170, partial [Acinetobacter baumannii]